MKPAGGRGMETYVLTALVGIAGAIVMSALMYGIHYAGLAEADMIRAIGSIVTKSEDDALFLGSAIHLASGVIFAFVYVGFFSIFPFEGVVEFFLFGFVGGAFHGLVVSFILVSVVAVRHPLERFRQAGFGVAVAHLIGHVVYGGVIGAAAGFYRLRFDFIADLGPFPS